MQRFHVKGPTRLRRVVQTARENKVRGNKSGRNKSGDPSQLVGQKNLGSPQIKIRAGIGIWVREFNLVFYCPSIEWISRALKSANVSQTDISDLLGISGIL